MWMTRRRTGMTVAVAGVVACAGLWAIAADDATAPAGQEARLAKVLENHPEADADGDGVLTPEEARAYFKDKRGGHGWKGRPGPRRFGPSPEQILERHPEADTDGDGTLSPEEMQAFIKTQHPERYAAMQERLLAAHPELDTDGDGVLSDAEMLAARETLGPTGLGGPRPCQPHPGAIDWLVERFDEVDTDGNGELSKDELIAFKQTLPPPAMGPGMGMGPGHGGPRGGPGARGRGVPDPAKILERHPEADTDGDGVLSDAELQAFKEQRRGGKRGGPKGKPAPTP